MRFRPEEDGSARRPPNYFSRRVQFRLLVLVSMFMLVLVMMDKVRDPAMWQWLWSGENAGEAAETAWPPAIDITAGSVDTQLPPSAPPETPAIPDSISTAPRPLGELPKAGAPDQRARDDMWARLLQSLSTADQSLLDRALKRHRDQQPLEAAQRDLWQALLPQLQTRVEKYFRDAKRATEHSTLAEPQQAAWLELLARQQSAWESETLAALRSLGGDVEDRSDAVSARLEEVQQSLDRLAMANIKDNTVMRADEGRAWFRMFERLQRAPAETLTAENSQRVGFLQLFRQPDVFRGKLVTVHGTLELAYRLKAPANSFDVLSYYILWLRPTGGPANPIVVYTLELPPGFPEVADRDVPGQEAASTEFSPGEEVDVTGYYFKNWAYRSREGINTAPLLLARVPNWTPPARPAADGLQLTWKTALISIVGTGLLAAVLAVLAFRSSVFPKRAEDDQSKSLKALEKLAVSTTAEHLEDMSRRDEEESK